MQFFMAEAYAQAANGAAPAQPSFLQSMFPLILIFFVFYFLMIRPQKKKLQQEAAFLSGLNKGDEIYTKSGILGTITGITEKIVTVEVSEGTKVKVLRSQIAGLAKKLFEKNEAKK